MAFYELRQYKVRPGKIDQWVKIMEEEIIPFQVSKGMVICGSFRGETDPSVYVWLRRFESEAERDALYKAVYETDYWKTKIAPRDAFKGIPAPPRAMLPVDPVVLSRHVPRRKAALVGRILAEAWAFDFVRRWPELLELLAASRGIWRQPRC